MSRIYEQQLVKEIDQAALTLWARMVTLLENANDRIEKLEERVKSIDITQRADEDDIARIDERLSQLEKNKEVRKKNE